MRRLLTALFTLFIASCASEEWSVEEAQDVTVQLRSGALVRGACGGVAVGPHHFVTVEHCGVAHNPDDTWVLTWNRFKKNLKPHKVRLLKCRQMPVRQPKTDNKDGWCLYYNPAGFESWAPITSSCDSSAMFVGHGGWTNWRTKKVEKPSRQTRYVWYTQGTFGPGDSGGPLFCDGGVIGIMHGYQETDKYAGFVTLEGVEELLND